MSLDVRFTVKKDVVCPHCGEVVMTTDEQTVCTGGRGWYPILEDLGYYVPYDERTEENDWYGKDMVLTDDQLSEVYRFVRGHTLELYRGLDVLTLILLAREEKALVAVNADW